MKVSTIAWFLVALFFGATYAGNIDVDENVNVRASRATTWTKSDITATPEALHHGDAWLQKAYDNPDRVVPIVQESAAKRVGLLVLKTATIVKVGIKYTTDAKTIEEIRDVVVDREITSSDVVICFALSLALFVLFNVMFFRRESDTISIGHGTVAGGCTIVVFLCYDFNLAVDNFGFVLYCFLISFFWCRCYTRPSGKEGKKGSHHCK